MGDLQSILAVLGGLVVLAGALGGAYAFFRKGENEEHLTIIRQQRDDYLSRLNFIEPRVKLLEQQNDVLLTLHNPSGKIEELQAQEQKNHEQTVELLTATHDTLKQIEEQLMDHGEERRA